jgi:hypothetical protein
LDDQQDEMKNREADEVGNQAFTMQAIVLPPK